MKYFVTVLTVLAVLAAVLGQIPQGSPHESQGWPHQNQGRNKRQADNAPPELERAANWTTCDVTTTPIISCHDCSTRLVCKPIGGLLIVCRNPFRPHCNNGTCSAVPSAECA